MPVTIKFDKNQCEAKIKTAWDKSLFPLSSQILGDCNQFVKVDQWTLMKSSGWASKLSKGRLVWDTPYAKRQYWEIKTAHKQPNPNATWKWCETAKRKYKADWQKLAEKLLRENL